MKNPWILLQDELLCRHSKKSVQTYIIDSKHCIFCLALHCQSNTYIQDIVGIVVSAGCKYGIKQALAGAEGKFSKRVIRMEKTYILLRFTIQCN